MDDSQFAQRLRGRGAFMKFRFPGAARERGWTHRRSVNSRMSDQGSRPWWKTGASVVLG